MKKTLLLFVWAFTFGNVIFILNSGCYKRGEICANYMNVAVMAWDNAGKTPHAVDEGGVLAKAFYLHVIISDSTITCAAIPNVPFVNIAYAGTDNRQQIDSIAIVSNHDFDASHPAGTALNDLFYIPKGSTKPGDYYLINNPTDTATHNFMVKVFLKNPDKTLIAVTPPIKLLL